MRSHVEFRSTVLSDAPDDESVPKGKAIASLFEAELPKHGYQIERVYPEDWGWCVQLANSGFPLWIGCGHYQEYPDGHLCFIEPSRPFIRRWLKKIPTAAVVERLANAVDEILRGNADIYGVRWWTDAETAGG